MKAFNLEIITPEKKIYSGTPYSVIVPAHEGYLGIMSGHAPFLGILNAGQVTVRIDNQPEQLFQITGGVLDIGPGQVTILADETK